MRVDGGEGGQQRRKVGGVRKNEGGKWIKKFTFGRQMTSLFPVPFSHLSGGSPPSPQSPLVSTTQYWKNGNLPLTDSHHYCAARACFAVLCMQPNEPDPPLVRHGKEL